MRDSVMDYGNNELSVTNDPIKPNHYKGTEVLDIIEDFTGDLNGVQAFMAGNIIKYVLRWKNKNGIEDLRKAKEYIDLLIKNMEKAEEQ